MKAAATVNTTVNASQPSQNCVNKANHQTHLAAALKKDTEASMIDLLTLSYSKRLQSFRSKAPSSASTPNPAKPLTSHDDICSRLDPTTPATIIFKLSLELNNLISNLRGRVCCGLPNTDELIAKVAARGNSSITKHHSLEYLQEHLPHFPVPRPHGVLRWDNFDLFQKKAIGSQIRDLLLQLRSLAAPDIPLSDVKGDGCLDRRRFARTSSGPIMDAERFEDFITVDYRNSSGVYAQMVRELGSSSTKCVFTHGDLRPANIMVDTGHWLGFYPEYWESVKKTNNLMPKGNWDWYKYLAASVSDQQWLIDRVRDPNMFNS
ncbi:kinase-like domain-containing protein [Nemania diffusa]|nr:kinase-like domain-containing protein [Nemania diffusa]